MWKVGNGVEVRIGMDPLVGCKWRHLLLTFLIDKLHSVGSYLLKYIGCIGVSLLMEHAWLTADNLGLVDN